MKTSEKFQEFLSNFRYLAGVAQIPESQLKSDLWRKLTPTLRLMTQYKREKVSVGFAAFATHCSAQYDLSTTHEKLKSSFRSNNPTKDSNNKGSTAVAKTANSDSTQVKLSPEEREKLRKSGSCYSCKQPGHMASTCPLKKTQLVVNT
ncbi:hypothetical protein N7466_004470 [Penicillium verhagenii]|uniref:uncharacterized protein n=1 Tax=Penicillium verhagenii TaxID=1562060 RepID=UPI002545ABB4|nr:uncharacterized protein N7466_004470 [Penicillium verhagenii]KAJ5934923.1 hypothetical protein N7466_004470 [Penicillium verhagenii]